MHNSDGDPTTNVTFGGLQIPGYEPGSAICDSVMTEFCTDSASLQNIPGMQDVCACILDDIDAQREMGVYTKTQIPTHCRSQSCSGGANGVYKTRAHLQDCSTKLCTQSVSTSAVNTVLDITQVMDCNTQSNNSLLDNPSNENGGDGDMDTPLITYSNHFNYRALLIYMGVIMGSMVLLCVIILIVRKYI